MNIVTGVRNENVIDEFKRDGFLNYMLRTPMDPENHQTCFGRVLTVREDESIPSVFRKLSREGFLSAPVLDENRRYVGFISMMDLVKYTTELFWGTTTDQWVDFWDKEDTFSEATVEDVMDKASSWKTVEYTDPVYQGDSTFFAVEQLARSNAHRLAVLNMRSQRYANVVGIWTHSMIMSEITSRVHLIDRELLNKRVKDMTHWQLVYTVRETEKAINAFNKMVNKGVHGLAVVDDAGVLKGTISARDLRGIGTSGENFVRLFTDVRKFKSLVRDENPRLGPRSHYNQGKIPLTGLYVRQSDTFEDVIKKMKDGNIHRLFVVTDESARQGKPIPVNVISQTDVVRTLMNQYTLFSL